MAKLLLFGVLLAAVSCTAPARDQQPGAAEGARAAAGPAEAAAGVSGKAGAGLGGTVRLALLPPSRSGDAGTSAGILEAEGPCVYLRTPGGERMLLAFTVPGIGWDASAGALTLSGRDGALRLRPGDRVRVGGSQASAAALSDKWVAAPADGCNTSRIWVANTIAAEAG